MRQMLHLDELIETRPLLGTAVPRANLRVLGTCDILACLGCGT